MSILTVKCIETIAIDAEELRFKERTLTRLIVAAAHRKFRNKRALLSSPATVENLPKDHLASERDSE
jgi:hypothetical protein